MRRRLAAAAIVPHSARRRGARHDHL